MNYWHLLFCVTINGMLFIQNVLAIKPMPDDDIKNVLTTKLDPVKSTQFKKTEKPFRFDYSDTLITDILQDWATLLNINILLPQGAQTIKTKITYKLDEPLSLHDVENLLVKFLDIIGYTIKHQNNMVVVLKNDQQPERQALDIYINSALAQLPNNEQMINYVYYMNNLSIKVSGNDLKTILADMLSKNAKIITDEKSNALIITDKSNNIQSAMKIIIELDEGGLRDAAEVLPIYYTSASLIEDLFKKLIPQKGEVDTSTMPYFPKNTKILALERTNSLVIMGTTRSINIVKEFIVKYIDHPLESGRSILHIYDLQYLNSEEFAPILQNIVRPPSQPTQATGSRVGGPKQYFVDVIVAFEKYKESQQLQPTQAVTSGSTTTAPTAEGTKIGGNRLIVAARYEDWTRIKKLIEELDKPQFQVALEVLIIDLTTDRNRSLGSQLRNKKGFDNSTLEGLNFQSAQLAPPVLKPATGEPPMFPPDALAANLLQLTNGVNIANNVAVSPPGSFVFSLEDKTLGVWNVWRLLNQYMHSTILSQPFLITRNKEKASVTVAETRLLKAGAESSTVSALNINYEDVTAGTTVDMLPTISKDGNINLLITVQINEYAGPTTDTRITRVVQTNANVGNGEILALGGLTKTTNADFNQGVPVLSRVPLVGWFFKQKTKNIRKSNLLVLIHPTIIRPYTAGGVNIFTAEKIDIAKADINQALTFDNLRDPITRWFFKPDYTLAEETVGDYVRKTDELRAIERQKRRMRSAQEAQKMQEFIASTNQEEDRAQRLQKLMQDEENPLSLLQNVKDEVVFNS